MNNQRTLPVYVLSWLLLWWVANGPQASAITADDIDRALRQTGTWVDWPSNPFDGFKFNAHKRYEEVRVVGVCWMPSLAVLRRAEQLGCDLLIHHEPLCYGWDVFDTFDPAYRERFEILERSGMIAYRSHDVQDRLPVYGVNDQWSQYLGLSGPVVANYLDWYKVRREAPRTVRDWAVAFATVGARRGLPYVRLVGNPNKIVTDVAYGTGAIAWPTFMYQYVGGQMTVSTELSWSNDAHWAIENNYPIIQMDHGLSELPGVHACKEYMLRQWPQLEWHFLDNDLPFALVRGSTTTRTPTPSPPISPTATPTPTPSATTGPVSAQRILDRLITLGWWVDWETTRDGLHYNTRNSQRLVRIAGVCWEPSLPAIQQALALGCDLLVHHQPVFYDDNTPAVLSDPGYALKKQVLDQTGLVLLRVRDYADRLWTYGIPDQWYLALGLQGPVLRTWEFYLKIAAEQPQSVQTWAQRCARAGAGRGVSYVRLVGNPQKSASLIGYGAASYADPVRFYNELGGDVSIVSEMVWSNTAHWAIENDAPVIVVDRGVAELPGLRGMAQWLAHVWPGVTWHFIDNPLPVRLVRGIATPTPTPTPSVSPRFTPHWECPAQPKPGDQDGDRLADDVESEIPDPGESNRFLWDSDGDGLADGFEDANVNGRRDAGETSTRQRDSDGDGLWDSIEIMFLASDPLSAQSPGMLLDSDGDGLPLLLDPHDGRTDTDGDRFTDGIEAVWCNLEAVAQAAWRPPLGDGNCDGAVSNLDALVVQSLFLRTVPHATLPGEINLDTNRDGVLSNLDALLCHTHFFSLGTIPAPAF